MKASVFSRAFAVFLLGAFAAFLASSALRWTPSGPAPIAQAEDELAVIKGQLADQSHAMEDVARHFSNLWFAGQKKNWPLATFFLDETQSHLRWAVRMKPVRKTGTGQDINLGGILESIENTFFTQLRKAIEDKDREKFALAYRKSIEGCYSCHKTSEKPYLRPQIPEAPAAYNINFDPESAWPQ